MKTATKPATKIDDLQLVAHIAFHQYEVGEISLVELIEALQECVNARAATNGYAEQHGMPFPKRVKR